MAQPTEYASSATAAANATPAMRQYFDAKRQYRDAIIFFRMGDFYEMFYEDALVAARALELTLTSRSKDASGGSIPMCGVPYHAVDGYLARLVKKGFRVAICEQVEDPKKAKGLVRREVVRVVSPGTLTDARLPRRPGAGVPDGPGARVCARPEGRPGRARAPIRRRSPDRPLDRRVPHGGIRGRGGPAGAGRRGGRARPPRTRRPGRLLLSPITFPPWRRWRSRRRRMDAWSFEAEAARASLVEQFRTKSLDGFGLEDHPLAVRAGGALVRYLRDTQKVDLAHVRAATFRQTTETLVVDPITLRHLEVVEASTGGREGSLLGEIDRTVTAMGGRLLRQWLLRPLLSLERVRDRLDAVEDYAFKTTERGKFRDTLKAVQDLERLVSRTVLGSAGPRDLVALKQSLGAIPRVRMIHEEMQAPLLRSLAAELDDVPEVRAAIEAAIADDPPALARDGGFVRDGFDPSLDELRTISRSGKQVIAQMEEQERARTGIPSLKVRYNRVFGYYIEVSKSNLHAVPADYLRKQTIAGGERYITPALKEYEEKVLGADERILEREIEVFERLRAEVAALSPRIQDTARALAALDALAALAETATINNYTKPHVHEGDEIADPRRPPPGRRAPLHRGVRPERHASQRDDAPARHPDRAQHGRQVDLPAPGGDHLAARAGRLVRAGAPGEAGAGRPHLHARRRLGQHRARPVHVHGRDAGDGQHPALRDVAQPGHPRRDRPRHGDVRRPQHRLGRRRVPGHQPAGAPQDDLRHALPRADRPRRRDRGRGELPRGRARVARRHHLPAQGRRGPVRPQLRHPGGQAGRASPRRSSSGRRRSSARSSTTS